MKNLDANEYLKILLKILTDNDFIDNVFFISTDGANVVRSTQNGLVGKLTLKISHLKSIHCMAHRAALGIKELTESFPLVKEINNLIYHIISLF